MRKRTQVERVLAQFRRAGDRGVCASEFSGAYGGCVDDGPPIPRFAARVMELREAGHVIDATGGKRHGTKVFRLRESVPDRSELHEFARQMEALSLAALAPAPRNAIHDEDAA